MIHRNESNSLRKRTDDKVKVEKTKILKKFNKKGKTGEMIPLSPDLFLFDIFNDLLK